MSLWKTAILVGIAACVMTACAPEEAVVEIRDADGSMVSGFRSDAARTGSVEGATLGVDPVVAFRIQGDEPVIASPVVAGDLAFVPDGSGELIAFDPFTGQVLWASPIGSSDASVVLSPDSVFSVSSSGTVRRHDLDSGSVIWEADLDGFSRSSPLLAEGLLWVAAGEELSALDPSSGVRVSSVPLDASSDSSPAAAASKIVIGTRANTLAFVDVDTLEVDQLTLPPASADLTTYADGVAATPAISNGSVYVGSTGGTLVSSSLSGEVRWMVDLASPIYGAVAFGGGTGFVPTASGSLVAFDLDSGEVRWTAELGDAAYASPVVVGETVIAAAESGRLFGFETATGDQLWNVEVGVAGNYMSSTPAVAGSTIVLGSNDGSIVGVSTQR